MQSKLPILVSLAAVLVVAAFTLASSERAAVRMAGPPRTSGTSAPTGRPEPYQPVTAAPGFLTRGESSEPSPARRPIVADGSPGELRAPTGAEVQVRLRASRLANELGLTTAAEEALCTVLLREQTRRAAAIRELRGAPNQAETRERVRTELDAILAWKASELRARFGPERAASIMRR